MQDITRSSLDLSAVLILDERTASNNAHTPESATDTNNPYSDYRTATSDEIAAAGPSFEQIRMHGLLFLKPSLVPLCLYRFWCDKAEVSA